MKASRACEDAWKETEAEEQAPILEREERGGEACSEELQINSEDLSEICENDF